MDTKTKTAVLTRSLSAWGSDTFEATLKEEIAQLGADFLPLQQGLSSGSTSLDANLEVMILRVTEWPDRLRVRAGIFYSSIISGCSCADDPTPVDENREYCEVDLEIDRESGEVRAALAGE
jgi:hypothetical protein